MEPIKIIETTVIERNKFTAFIVTYLIGGALITVYFAAGLRNLYLSFLGLFIFLVCPLTFPKLFRKKFSRSVTVKFFDDFFSVDFKERDSEVVLKTDINRFDEIKFFKVYDSSINDFSYLKLIFADDTKVDYSFSSQINDGKKDVDINVQFRKSILIYNSNKPSTEKIKIIPDLFAKKTGLYFILTMSIFMITVIIFQIIYYPKTLVISIFGFAGIFLQMFYLRKKTLAESKKFN